ncbi:MAG TPA: prolipoprotein diacylglyceryl transferase family protein [Micromonosporaceae bacterium]|nr:prolipoprotein diacylglyceryl transferase family protein [Micromonosporaceae bacterium]
MYPVLLRLGPVAIGTHDVLVALGIAVAALVFWAEVRRRRVRDERIWYVVAGALVGGALLGRLGTWLQHLDPRDNASLLEQWAYGNRSILSGLVGAYIGAIVAKRLCGYTDHTGDFFAPAVAAGMAVGRLGCLLTELPGTPTGLPWGITLTAEQAGRIPGAVAGVALHPSFGYEIAFHLLAFVALRALRSRITEPGELFKLYLLAYAGFRFAVEFVRGNEVVLAGLTRPQLFLLVVVPLAAWHLIRQARRGVYRRAPRGALEEVSA